MKSKRNSSFFGKNNLKMQFARPFWPKLDYWFLFFLIFAYFSVFFLIFAYFLLCSFILWHMICYFLFLKIIFFYLYLLLFIFSHLWLDALWLDSLFSQKIAVDVYSTASQCLVWDLVDTWCPFSTETPLKIPWGIDFCKERFESTQ